MKAIKYISFFVYVLVFSFLVLLYCLVTESSKYIESNFFISVSLEGNIHQKVVADRILALSGVKDVRIISAAKLYEDFKAHEVFGKIKLEENPFKDSLIVIPEIIKTAGVGVLVNQLKQIGGVGEVVYDTLTPPVYEKLKLIAMHIKIALVILAGFIIVVFIVGVYRKKQVGFLSLKILFPDVYIFITLSLLCLIIGKFAYSAYGLGYNYLFQLSFLTISALIAPFIYEK